jgi:hypothetical protein
MKPCPRSLHLAFATSLGLAAPVVAQKHPVTQPIVTAAMAGQSVAVLPATMVIVEPTVPAGLVVGTRPVLLKWVDSVVAESFANRAPEVKWILPAELRRMYRKSGGILPDPDALGQSLMRTWAIKVIPDPLRSNLRRLVSMIDGRLVFIPASVTFTTDSAGRLMAEMAAVLADVRNGQVVWRSVAKGQDGTPDQVLGKALATIFPTDPGTR